MKYYQEISLLRDAKIGLYDFWQKLYPQIHLALVENKCGDHDSAIGVTFPEYDADELSLGTRLRIFAETKQELELLKLEKWLNRLTEYVQLSLVLHVPEQVSWYACFKQVKPKGSKEKLARRRSKRTGETFQQALVYYESYTEERSSLPYINIHSETNGHRFRLFIEQKLVKKEQIGLFSCYGLSNKITVPIF